MIALTWLVSCAAETGPRPDDTAPTTPEPGPWAGTCRTDGGVAEVASAALYGGPLEGLGSAVASAGDVDGDGAPDLLVSGPGNGTNGEEAGAVYLIRGGADLPSDLTGADAWLGAAGEGLGFIVGAAGDIDADGHADVVVGAFGYDGAAENSGAAYLVFGGPSGLDPTRRVTIAGIDADGATGRGARAGDLDQDGLGDLLVSTEFGVEYAGGVGLFYGSSLADGAQLTTADADVAFLPPGPLGQLNRIAGGGDIDGDGTPELAMAALGWEEESGAVYLYFGANSLAPVQDLAAGMWDVRWTGTAASLAGHEVAFVGDIDGDGRDDLGIGAPYESSIDNKRGAAYFVTSIDEHADQSLDQIGTQFDGAMLASRFGLHLDGGDIDGDGVSELMFGAKFEDRAGFVSGTVYVTEGPVAPGHYAIDADDSPATSRVTGEAEGDQMGVVVFAGDLNRDGFGDLALGARYHGGGPDAFTDDGTGALYLMTCGATLPTP